MSETKRKKDVLRAKSLRVRVARLSWCFERSGVGEADAGTVTVSSEAWRRVKKRIVSSFIV